MDIETFDKTIKNQIVMDKNQFYYIRREMIDGTGDNPKFKEFIDSFNINKVIRSIHMENDSLLVLLDDIQERVMEVPNINPRSQKQNGFKRERQTLQSEIYLYGNDINRFRNLTSIELSARVEPKSEPKDDVKINEGDNTTAGATTDTLT